MLCKLKALKSCWLDPEIGPSLEPEAGPAPPKWKTESGSPKESQGALTIEG
jgi:hypothetical protein